MTLEPKSISNCISVILFVLSFSNAGGQNLSDHINIINQRVQNNCNDNQLNGKPIFTVRKTDSLCLNFPILSNYEFKIALSDIICISAFKKSNRPRVVFYIMNGADEFPGVYSLHLNHVDSIDTLVSNFFQLYLLLGKEPPMPSCLWYENDLMAEKFETCIKGWLRNDKMYGIWGVDSDYTGKLLYRYINGNVRFEKNTTIGVYNGEQKEYFQNGQLSFHGFFVNGLAIGKHYYYDSLGKLYKESSYVKGTLCGISKEWWPNGIIKLQQKYYHGRLKQEQSWDITGKREREHIVSNE
jgi:hypothetical protein